MLGRLAFLSRITHNPVIVTVLAAIIFSALNMSMPTPLEKTLTMIGSCTTVLALFLVGGTIRWRELAARQSEQSESRVIATVVSSKLILHPLIVWFFVWCWKPLDYNLQISAVLLAMMPTFLSYPVLTSQYGLTRISSSIVAISTPLGILSLSFLLWIAL